MYRSTYFYLGANCRWVVSFMPRPLYAREKRPRYVLDRQLYEQEGSSGNDGKIKKMSIIA
jgi:hypothetical protein